MRPRHLAIARLAAGFNFFSKWRQCSHTSVSRRGRRTCGKCFLTICRKDFRETRARSTGSAAHSRPRILVKCRANTNRLFAPRPTTTTRSESAVYLARISPTDFRTSKLFTTDGRPPGLPKLQRRNLTRCLRSSYADLTPVGSWAASDKNASCDKGALVSARLVRQAKIVFVVSLTPLWLQRWTYLAVALRAFFEASTKKSELNRFFPVVGLTPLEIPCCGPSQDLVNGRLRAYARAYARNICNMLTRVLKQAYAQKGKALRGPSDIGALTKLVLGGFALRSGRMQHFPPQTKKPGRHFSAIRLFPACGNASFRMSQHIQGHYCPKSEPAALAVSNCIGAPPTPPVLLSRHSPVDSWTM